MGQPKKGAEFFLYSHSSLKIRSEWILDWKWSRFTWSVHTCALTEPQTVWDDFSEQVCVTKCGGIFNVWFCCVKVAPSRQGARGSVLMENYKATKMVHIPSPPYSLLVTCSVVAQLAKFWNCCVASTNNGDSGFLCLRLHVSFTSPTILYGPPLIVTIVVVKYIRVQLGRNYVIAWGHLFLESKKKKIKTLLLLKVLQCLATKVCPLQN